MKMRKLLIIVCILIIGGFYDMAKSDDSFDPLPMAEILFKNGYVVIPQYQWRTMNLMLEKEWAMQCKDKEKELNFRPLIKPDNIDSLSTESEVGRGDRSRP
jgi:hypothetical protein